MKRGNEGGKEWLKQFDEEGLEREKQFVYVCQLQYALVRDLRMTFTG